jgi:hypothetical protein
VCVSFEGGIRRAEKSRVRAERWERRPSCIGVRDMFYYFLLMDFAVWVLGQL